MTKQEILKWDNQIIDMYTYEQLKTSECVVSIHQYDIGSRVNNHWLTIALLKDNTVISFYLPCKIDSNVSV